MSDVRTPLINQLVVIERVRPDGLTLPLGRAVVARITPAQLELDVPDPSVKLGLLSTGQRIVVQFWDPMGIYRAKTTVLRVQTDRARRIYVAKPAQVEAQQRRQFFRVEVCVPFTFQRVLDKTDSPDAPFFQEKTQDLSGGGLRFETDVALAMGERLEVALELSEKTPINVEGDIVRKAPARKPDRHSIGLNFVAIQEGARDRLIAFLFREQKRLMR